MPYSASQLRLWDHSEDYGTGSGTWPDLYRSHMKIDTTILFGKITNF